MIYIRKSGIFYENGYKPDTEEYVFTRVKSFIPYLNEVIHIDSEITLEDFFDILEKEEKLVNVVFGSHMGHHLLGPFYDEIKRDCFPEDREDLDYIECKWVIEHFDYKIFYEKFKDERRETESIFGPLREPEEDDVKEITVYVDVYGWGKYKPSKDEIYQEDEEPPSHITYAIEFIPLNKIRHIPIRLNKEFILIEEKYDGKKHIVMEGEKEFSVYEAFGAILSEFTFAGLPGERDEKWKDIIDKVDEYKEKMDEEVEENDDGEE